MTPRFEKNINQRTLKVFNQTRKVYNHEKRSMCLGSDINYNVMMAQGKSARMGQGDRKPEETLRGSLAHFGLENKYIGAAIIGKEASTCQEGCPRA